MTKLSHINYAFSTDSIHPVLCERHAEFVQARLSTLFGIRLDAVKVSSKPRLPDGVPFTLTCYSSRSESDAGAMATSAKYCLPHLEDMRKLSVDSAFTLACWTPGLDETKDLEAVGIVADGMGLRLDSDQREWLERKAASAGTTAAVDALSNLDLALVVYRMLSQRLKDRAMRKQSAAKYQRVRVNGQEAGDGSTTVSIRRVEYLCLARASKMNVLALNRYIRQVADELKTQTLPVPFSKAVVCAVKSRLLEVQTAEVAQ